MISGGENGATADLPVLPAVLTEVLQPGHEVLIDDGLVKLRVEEVDGNRVRTTVVVGGARRRAQGRQRPGRPDPRAVRDREGPA